MDDVIEESVKTIGTAHAGLSAEIGARLYAEAAPAKPLAPYVVFEKGGPRPVAGIYLDSGWYHTPITFTAFASSAKKAKEVIALVRAAFQRYHSGGAAVSGHQIDDAEATGDGDHDYDPELELFWEEIELEFFHN
jgi:uncharacterized protein DUF3168